MTTRIILPDNATSGSVPLASAINQGELVINTADGRLFTKNSSGQVLLLNSRGGGSGGGGATGATGPSGSIGVTGPQGVTGVTGPSGSIGVTGADGTTLYSGLTGVPVGIVSSSVQVVFSGITGVPTGLISSSVQVNTILDADNVVSSSAQVNYTGLTGVPVGIVSSSLQATTWTVASSSVATSASIAPTSWSLVTNRPTGLVSSSVQLPTGIVSSSVQATTWTVATASVATSASFATSASWAPGGGSPDWATVVNKPTGLVSGSAQVLALVSGSDITPRSGTFTGPITASRLISQFVSTDTGTFLGPVFVDTILAQGSLGVRHQSGSIVGYLRADAQNNIVRVGAEGFNIVSVDIGGGSSYQFGSANFVPVANDTVDLGTAANKWKSLNATSITGSISGTIRNSTLVNYTEQVVSASISAATLSLNLSQGNVFDVLVSQSMLVTFTNPPSATLADSVTVVARYDGTRTLTWASSIRWPGGTAPTISTTSGSTDIFTFVTINGGGRYFGVFSGKGY